MSLGDDFFHTVTKELTDKVDVLDDKLDQLQKNMIEVARVEERLLSFRETAARIGEEVKEVRRDVESRLRFLESMAPINKLTSSWILMGMIGVMSAVGGAIIAFFLRH